MTERPRGHRLRTFHALAGNQALVRMLAAYTLFTLIEYSVWLAMLVYSYSHCPWLAADVAREHPQAP